MSIVTLRHSERLRLIQALTGNSTDKYLSDQNVRKFATNRKAELMGKIGNTGVPWEKLYNDAIQTFTPISIAGNKLWLKADGLSLNDSDAVGSWTDFSGGSNHAIQGTALNKPTFKTNQVNGLPAILFDDSNDFLDTPSITMSDMTVCIVLKPTGSSDYSISFSGSGSENGIISNFSANTLEIYNTPRISAGSTSSSTFSLHTITRSATLGTVTYKNGTQVATDPTANTTNTGAVRIGDNYVNANPYGGYIAEIVLYNSSLSTSDRQLIESYLKTKYGL